MDPFNEPLNEIIFENRNKSYGAYVLRKEYNDNLKFGVLLAYAFAATIVVLGVLTGSKELMPPKLEVENTIDDLFIDNTPIALPKKPEMPDPPKEKPSAVVPPKNDVPQEAADEPLEQKDEPEQPQQPQEPVPLSDNERGEPGVEKGNGKTTDVSESDKVILVADVAPDMEGGVMKYLQKNLRYPEIAVENKTSGTVYLSFVVEKDGSVNDIKVLKSIGDGCEEEAIRVVKKMKWNPGKANGHPVRVQFTLPVKFVITP